MAEENTVKSLQQVHAETMENYQQSLMDGVTRSSSTPSTPAGVAAPAGGNSPGVGAGSEATGADVVQPSPGGAEIVRPQVPVGAPTPSVPSAPVLAPAVPGPAYPTERVERVEGSPVAGEQTMTDHLSGEFRGEAVTLTAEELNDFAEWRRQRETTANRPVDIGVTNPPAGQALTVADTNTPGLPTATTPTEPAFDEVRRPDTQNNL